MLLALEFYITLKHLIFHTVWCEFWCVGEMEGSICRYGTYAWISWCRRKTISFTVLRTGIKIVTVYLGDLKYIVETWLCRNLPICLVTTKLTLSRKSLLEFLTSLYNVLFPLGHLKFITPKPPHLLFRSIPNLHLCVNMMIYSVNRVRNPTLRFTLHFSPTLNPIKPSYFMP